MNEQQLIDKLNTMQSEHTEFQVINDRRISEIERKGSADPLTVEHLDKLNDRLSRYEDQLRSMRASISRPAAEAANYSADHSGEVNYKSAFCDYIRKGKDAGLHELEVKSLSAHVDSESGFLITSRMSDHIERELELASPLRRIASVAQISTDALEIIDETSVMQSGWTEFVTDFNKSTDIRLKKNIIPVHEIFAQPRVTQKILDDPRIDIEEWLSKKLIDVFTREENMAFLAGDGKGKPKGLLRAAFTNHEIVVDTGTKGQITADSIMKLFYSLKETHASRAKFLMSRNVLQAIRMLKDTASGRYLWQPSFALNAPDTLLGAEVVECAEMPTMVEGAYAVALADFKEAYQIVDRRDIRVLRDPYTDKPFIKYYATKRVGGAVNNVNAMRLLRLQ